MRAVCVRIGERWALAHRPVRRVVLPADSRPPLAFFGCGYAALGTRPKQIPDSFPLPFEGERVPAGRLGLWPDPELSGIWSGRDMIGTESQPTAFSTGCQGHP